MQAILFDLDGTLIDTAPDIMAALNLALRRRGLPPATQDQVRAWIGDGTRASLAKARKTGELYAAEDALSAMRERLNARIAALRKT